MLANKIICREKFCLLQRFVVGGFTFINCPVFWKRVVLGNIWKLCKIFPFYFLSTAPILYAAENWLNLRGEIHSLSLPAIVFLAPIFLILYILNWLDLDEPFCSILRWYFDLWGI